MNPWARGWIPGIATLATAFSIVGSSPVAGQVLYDAGIALAALDRGGVVVDSSVTQEGHCQISEALLVAEAERTLRRDGITTRRTFSAPGGTELFVSVLALPTGLDRCAVAIDVQLVVVLNLDNDARMLAAQSINLIVWRDYVDETRRVVERNVSVMANAVRRARESVASGR